MEEIQNQENKEKIELIKRAFTLKKAKKYKDAITTLYKAISYDEYDRDNAELLSQIGELHMFIGNYERALEEFKKALSINENHEFSMQKCYEIYKFKGEYEKASDIAHKMYNHAKNEISCYCYFESLIALNKSDEAIRLFNELDEDVKLDADILYLISTVSDPNRREFFLKRIVELDETNAKANMELAKLEFDRGNLSEVLKYCLNIDENNPQALYYIGYIEAQRNNYTRAIEAYLKAIKYDKEGNDYYLDLAKAYIDSNSFTEALDALKRSINISLAKDDKTKLDEKYFLSAWILIKQNELSKALLNLSSIKETSEFYQNAQILIQTINLKKLDLALAKTKLEEYFRQDLEIRKNPFLIDTLALCYKELKLYSKAIGLFRRALDIFPNSNYYKLEIIDLLIDDKKYDEALKMVEEFIALNQRCANVYNSLTRIYYRLKEYDKALESINKYLELDNNNAESYYFKGLILNDLGRFEEAKETIFWAIRINPTVAKYYNQMARSFMGLEQFEDALIYAKEAIEINQNELSFKKQAYEIALKLGDEKKIELYKNQLKRSEEILRRR